MKEPNIRLRALELEDLDFLYHIENDEALGSGRFQCAIFPPGAARLYNQCFGRYLCRQSGAPD